jgi:hypothetical protein
MEDIYTGDLVSAWEDNEGFIFLSFPSVTINIPSEEWDRVIADLKKLVIAVRESELKKLKEDLNERKN